MRPLYARRSVLMTPRSALGPHMLGARGLATYKGDTVKVVFDGIELENFDPGEEAEDDKDPGHEEQCPQDRNNPDIPQRYGEITQIR